MRNLTFYKTLIALTLLVAVVVSCSKRQAVGPSINELYGPITFVKPFAGNNDSVDFSVGEVANFTAQFAETKEWTITITGKTSKAVKTITGVSNVINAENSIWDGGADKIPSFQKEEVTATLSFVNNIDTRMTDIVVLGTFSGIVNSVLVTDFHAINVGWKKDWPAVTSVSDATNPDGNAYLVMSGTPWQGSPITAYVNYLNIPATKADVPFTKYFPLWANADKVYFNLMVYGSETPDPGYLKVMFFEDHNGSNVVAKSFEITPSWKGWKLISVRYSDMIADISIPADPTKITSVQYVLLSSATPPESKAVKLAFDHAVFTLGGPYQP